MAENTTPKVYVICDQNCKFESMTKEQILAAIAQAVETGQIGDCDTGFITTIKTINGQPLRFFVGPQHEFDALSNADKQNLFAIITNDTYKDGILSAIIELQTKTEQNAAAIVLHATSISNLNTSVSEIQQTVGAHGEQIAENGEAIQDITDRIGAHDEMFNECAMFTSFTTQSGRRDYSIGSIAIYIGTFLSSVENVIIENLFVLNGYLYENQITGAVSVSGGWRVIGLIGSEGSAYHYLVQRVD